jgi:uncharacterized membrane protein YkvA (DUF1232 family)
MFKRAISIFRALLKDTAQYQKDQRKADALAGRAWAKAERERGPIATVFTDLTAFTRMVHAWATGKYPVPWKSMAWILAGLFYFLDPIDAIPDIIPIIGYIDDAFVISLVMRGVRKDVERFRAWPPEAAHS